MEEGVDLWGLTLVRVHLLLQEVYEDFPHHNDGTYIVEGVPDDATQKSHWRNLAAQLASWYSRPPSKAGHRFLSVLTDECRGVLDWKCNSKRPLVFAHVVLKRTLGACKARETRAIIDRRLDLWERGIHSGLVGEMLAEGRAREGRIE